MATSSGYKFNQFIEDLAKGVHNLGTHQLKVALTNTLPVNTNTVYTDIVSPIAATNLSGATPFNITTTSASQTAGTFKLIIDDLTLTATGSVGPFRYAVLYNNIPSSPAKPLIEWFDYGSSITLGAGESLKLDFDNSVGVITLNP